MALLRWGQVFINILVSIVGFLIELKILQKVHELMAAKPVPRWAYSLESFQTAMMITAMVFVAVGLLGVWFFFRMWWSFFQQE